MDEHRQKNDISPPECAHTAPKHAKETNNNSFLKNEAGELLKTKDKRKKRTGNEAETKLAMLLKVHDRPEKRTGNEPENEVGQVIENTMLAKNEAELERLVSTPPACRQHRPRPSRRVACRPFSQNCIT